MKNSVRYLTGWLIAAVFYISSPALAAINPANVPAVASIAALKNVGAGSALYPVVKVEGYYTQGDGFSATFVWNAASTATTSVCGPFQATGVSTGRWISQQAVSLRGCGAKGDGVTNDAPAANAAGVTTSADVNVEAGTYLFSTAASPSSGQKWQCQPGAQFNFASASRAAFSFTGLSHVHFDGCTWNNTGSAASAVHQAIEFSTSTDIWAENNRTIGTGLLQSTSTAANYAAVNSGNLTYGVHVNHNVIGNSTTSATIANAGIILLYTSGWEALDNEISGTSEGIQWWGGDADPAVNGTMSNTRWNLNGGATRNNIHNIAGGCLWGSMGQNIVNSANNVSNCGDVGFDDEGGVGVQFVGGSCAGAANGCLTTFWLPRATLFSGITVNQASGPMFRTYNSTLAPQTTSVSVVGSSFNWTGTGMGVVDSANGPVWSLEFTGNSLVDTRISFTATNQHFVTVSGNRLRFTKANTGALSGIQVNAITNDGSADGVGRIVGNDVFSEVAQPASSFAIDSELSDPNAPDLVIIQGNSTVFPSRGDIRVIANSSNAGVSPVFAVDSNILGTPSYARTEAGAGTGIVLLTNNRKATGGVYPSTSDIGSIYWNVGQQFLDMGVSAGGFIGRVETTAGAPGTQKTFGAVTP